LTLEVECSLNNFSHGLVPVTAMLEAASRWVNDYATAVRSINLEKVKKFEYWARLSVRGIMCHVSMTAYNNPHRDLFITTLWAIEIKKTELDIRTTGLQDIAYVPINLFNLSYLEVVSYPRILVRPGTGPSVLGKQY
jgi:hypothetical protein